MTKRTNTATLSDKQRRVYSSTPGRTASGKG